MARVGFNINCAVGTDRFFGGVAQYPDGSLSGYVLVGHDGKATRYEKPVALWFAGAGCTCELASADGQKLTLGLAPEFNGVFATAQTAEGVIDPVTDDGEVVTTGYFRVYGG